MRTVEKIDFITLYEVVRQEISEKIKKEPSAKRKLYQVAYMYQAERLPVVLQRNVNQVYQYTQTCCGNDFNFITHCNGKD